MEDIMCFYVGELRNSNYLKLITVKLMLCIIGATGVSWLGHPNAKVIFAVHCLWTILTPVTFIVAYAFEIFRMIQDHVDPCDYLISEATSFYLRLPCIFCVAAQTSTMLSIAIERVVSTIIPGKYERQKSFVPGLVFIVLMNTVAVTFVCWFVTSPNRFLANAIARSPRTNDNNVHFNFYARSTLTCELITICLFFICLLINIKRLRDRKHNRHGNLGRKYQIMEDKRIIVTLFPCFLVHFLLSLFGSIGMYFMTLTATESDPVTIVINTEYASQIYLYSVILPVVLIIEKKCRRRASDVVDVDWAGNFYACRLEEFWQQHTLRNPAKRKSAK